MSTALQFFGASRILVGHTIVPAVTRLYEGKVIAVQVYPRRDPQSGAGVRIEQGRALRAKADGTNEPL